MRDRGFSERTNWRKSYNATPTPFPNDPVGQRVSKIKAISQVSLATWFPRSKSNSVYTTHNRLFFVFFLSFPSDRSFENDCANTVEFPRPPIALYIYDIISQLYRVVFIYM